MENLENILKNESPAEETKQEAEPIGETTGIADPPSDRLRDEHGRFAKKEETGVPTAEAPAAEPTTQAPPAEQNQQLPPAEYAALKDERRKRQELERKLEAAIAQQQLFKQPPDHPPPSFWDDPDAAMAHMRQEMRNELLQSLRQEQQIERMNLSEAAAKLKYPDYPDAFAAFEQAVQYNPRLAQEMVSAADPAEYVYSKGKAALALEQHGSIEALLAAERQKWEAEVKGHVPAPLANLPSTTAADGSVGARSGPEWNGPPSLKEIVG
jgi:hypothetical protein